ncbi:MAG: polysaccharide deacetylase family protein [Planctomycetota bacterium]
MRPESRFSSPVWKRRLRTGIDQFARWSLLLGWFERRMRRGTTVLMYHRVLPDHEAARYPFASLAIPVSAFREQMSLLAERCHVAPLSEHLRSSARAGAHDRPRVAVTFDDGYADNAEIAAPILEDLGLRATFFVTTDFVAGHAPLWFDHAVVGLACTSAAARDQLARAHFAPRTAERLITAPLAEWVAQLKQLAPDARAEFATALRQYGAPRALPELYRALSPGQVGALAARGHEIGSHSVSHPLLPQLAGVELARELTASRDTISEWTGTRPEIFAYPNGDADARTRDATRHAGYAYACTVEPGIHRTIDDPLSIRRVDITPHGTLRAPGLSDPVAFRSEYSLLRRSLR